MCDPSRHVCIVWSTEGAIQRHCMAQMVNFSSNTQLLGKGSVCVLIMLDLSAAFDTIDHQILFHRFEHLYGITGKAMTWMSSYLCDRQQIVTVNGETPVCSFSIPLGQDLVS